MKKAFLFKGRRWNEGRVIDTETGDYFQVIISKDGGFPFSPYHNNLRDMGWTSAAEYLKKRGAAIGKEIPVNRLLISCQRGLLTLAKYRKRAGAPVDDIPGLLTEYGVPLDVAAHMVQYVTR